MASMGYSAMSAPGSLTTSRESLREVHAPALQDGTLSSGSVGLTTFRLYSYMKLIEYTKSLDTDQLGRGSYSRGSDLMPELNEVRLPPSYLQPARTHHTFCGQKSSRKRESSPHADILADSHMPSSSAQNAKSEKDAIQDLLATLGDDFELAIDVEEPFGCIENPVHKPRRSHERPFIIRRKTTQQRAFEAGTLNNGQYTGSLIWAWV